MTDRYVCLGLARVRSTWFAEVTRWSTSGSLAIEFVKSVSDVEVRARLASGRMFSAFLVDGDMPGVDRDLLAQASDAGCAPIVVSDRSRDWHAFGAVAVLPTDFTSAELQTVLDDVATPVTRADDLLDLSAQTPATDGFRARTIAVLGPGGTGTSVVAMAAAQGLAQLVEHTDTVVLADLALHADQAVLHDTGDIIPGLLELADAHRTGIPSADEVRSMTFDIVRHRYRLLLGLRRHRDWTAIRPRALGAALDSLRRSFTLVVADVDADLEGEPETGSADVEDRNRLARTVVELADLVVVVGAPGLLGTRHHLRVVRDCLAAGVPAERIVPVVNRAPRSRRARADLIRAHVELLATSHPGETLLSPVLLPDRHDVDAALRDGTGVPTALVATLRETITTRLEVLGERSPVIGDGRPEPVRPGSLGAWHDEESA